METSIKLPLPPSIIAAQMRLVEIGRDLAPIGAQISFAPQSDTVRVLGVGRGNLHCAVPNQQGQTLAIGQGVIVQEAMTFHADVECEYAWVTLAGTFALQLIADTYAVGGAFFPYQGHSVTTLVAGLMQIMETEHALDGCAVSSAAYTLLMHLFHQSAPLGELVYSALVTDAIAIMQREFAYLDGMELLAERLFVTKPHFIRTFTATVGISPGKYLTHVRIERAKLLLSSGDASIEAVAGACGFSGAAYFGKVFHKITGITPTQFVAAEPRSLQGGTLGEVYL